ncbi:MAG TPA: hypothetical protein ENH75_11630 [archaeon]|nr:hypothetical protein [archaeon]
MSTLIETKLLDLKHGQEIIIEKKPNDEIYGKNNNNNLKIHNYYFEITPPGIYIWDHLKIRCFKHTKIFTKCERKLANRVV